MVNKVESKRLADVMANRHDFHIFLVVMVLTLGALILGMLNASAAEGDVIPTAKEARYLKRMVHEQQLKLKAAEHALDRQYDKEDKIEGCVRQAIKPSHLVLPCFGDVSL